MKIGILGTGAFGIALAKTLNTKDNRIVMWTKFEEEKELLEKERENVNLFSGVKLDQNIVITTKLEEAVAGAKVIIGAIPFKALESLMQELKDLVYMEQIFCSTTKGIDDKSLKVTTEIIEENLICKVAALSGPSFAIDLVNKTDIAFMLGSKDKEAIKEIKELFKFPNIKIEETEDVIGIQLAGAVKNAISIGAGILESQGASESTKAKYLTDGLINMSFVLAALGGRSDTVYTFAGVGDLILTCTSDESRNYTFGKFIGEGLSLEEATEKMNGKVVEGVGIIKALYNLGKKKNLKLDIIDELYGILFEGKDVKHISKV